MFFVQKNCFMLPFVFVLLLAETTYAMQQAKKNQFFSLEDKALQVVLELSQHNALSQGLIAQLREARSVPLERLAFPTPLMDVIRHNLVWTLIREFGLEQQKIEVLTCEQMQCMPSDVLLKLQQDYRVAYQKKYESCPEDVMESLSEKAKLEALDILESMFKSKLMSSGGMSLFRVDDGNKEALCSRVRSMYDSEGCGICECAGADVFWFNHKSRCAHGACFELIKDLECDIWAEIEKAFGDNGDRNFAHVEVARAVRNACGCTLLEYRKKNGAEALKHLFDTVGLEALRKYSDGSSR
jgi:hypothetical protein